MKEEEENGVQPEKGQELADNTTTVENILSALKKMRQERWQDTRKRILTERRFICAMDRAAACPDWWHVNRLHYYNPDMTHAHIARLLGLKREMVSKWIRNVEIPEDDYEMLPLPDPEV